MAFYFVSDMCMSWYTLIKRKPDFSRKVFWTLEIPFKTGFTVMRVITDEP
jgi:hypothetical protein